MALQLLFQDPQTNKHLRSLHSLRGIVTHTSQHLTNSQQYQRGENNPGIQTNAAASLRTPNAEALAVLTS